MKTRLILTLALLTCFVSFSQVIEIYAYNTDSTDISGTTIVALPGTGFKKFSIRNMTGTDFNFRIERVKIMEADGVQDFLAFGKSDVIADGFPPDMVSPENPFITPISHTLKVDTLGYLGCHYINESNVGCSQYRYYILTDATERIDSIDVKFCLTVSLPENATQTITVFPNPVSEMLNFVSPNINSSAFQVVIYDLIGNQVYFNSEIPAQINCTFLDGGIYNLVLIDPQTKATIFHKKLVKK